MRKSFFILFIFSIVLWACNDGDVITVDLIFDQELSLCDGINSTNYIIYDTKTDPNESLTLLFPVNDANNLIFKPVDNPHEGTLNINSNTVRFIYRTYDGNASELICQDIPSSTVNIINDYEASSGTLNYSSSYIDVDGTRTVTIVFTITDTDLEILSTDLIELGTYTHAFGL